ncbi:T7SS effector LXG polymorphic toxin [Staphylococcus aureus]|uniref:T7SS effector LXG polymorphic toxin n=1 Tax=Staphylococcus aureus TaxID=1280 RepID=UPI0012B06B69|nr:T7SS effector LXG polymorphic toxin [Staphylococcus aureus]MCB8263229.1 transposase [Staphylococcus aureus]MCB8271435.1 transposase [Staphylococcus aureus]MCC5343334.1 LXG domain-containing protein [Staphylococcus aureus]MDT3276058.1 T7SS effector LXG polymorphic toxin [Staphylococcus aureus]MRX25153.1 transposase [Staphylococcus aureus]
MGYKVDMSEVHNMQKSIDSSLSAINTKVSTLNSSINNLINTEGFEGQAASSVKNYSKTFHLQSIKKIETINKDFKSDIAKSIRKFQSEVDNNASAILDEDEIKKYKKDIDDALKDVFKSSKDANGAISDVSDLTTAKKIKTENLANKMADFNKDIDQTVERLTNFDANNSIDGDKTDNLITELSGVNSYVKNMKPNRARISSTSGKIESAIARHKTHEELVKWQTYMETLSDNLYKMPGLSKTASDAILQAGREYYAIKAVGNGSALRGYQEYLKTRDINKLMNKMSKAQLQKLTLVFNTNKDNFKIKNAVKMASEFARNNPFKKGNLVNWMTKVQGYESASAQILKKGLQDRNFKYTFGDAKKFFDTAEMKKAAVTEFKNTFVPQNIRETFFKKENLTSKTALKKNMIKFWNEDIKGGIKEFKLDFANKNIIGKLGKMLKLGGKVLKPLAFITAITDNIDKKSKQERYVGMGVDLAAIGASAAAGAAAGAAIGSAVPLPVVGTLVGALAGTVAGIGLNYEIPYLNKSATELAKDGINSGINKVKSGFGKVTSGFKTVFG